MERTMKKTDYAAVDIFKMICAILVMLIHTRPFENHFWMDAGIGMITRFAVPYFFTISGYFLFKKVWGGPDHKWKTVSRYLFRLLRFYLIWFVIYRVFDILMGGDFRGLQYYIKQFFFTTDGSALWFIAALLWATVIVAIMSEWLSKKVVFAISIVFLLLGYCLSTLLGVTAEWPIIKMIRPVAGFINVQGGLFFAFPYVAMGALLAEQDLVKNVKKDMIMIILFFMCLGAESLLAVIKLKAPLTFLWISALPMTWYVTKLSLTIDLKGHPMFYCLRKMSTLVYVLHGIILSILREISSHIGIASLDYWNLGITLSTVLITMLLSYGLVKLSNRFIWLKYAM